MKTKTIKRKVKPSGSKKKGVQFDIDNFLLETFGAKPGHFSFDDLQNFARTGGSGKIELAALKKHLDACERCKSIYDDIVRFDPFLSIGESIPEGFWKNFWTSLEADLPPNVREILNGVADEVKSTVTGTVNIVLTDYYATLEGKIIELNSTRDLRRQKELLQSIVNLQQDRCVELFYFIWDKVQDSNTRLFTNIGIDGELRFPVEPNLTFVSTPNRLFRPQNVEIQA